MGGGRGEGRQGGRGRGENVRHLNSNKLQQLRLLGAELLALLAHLVSDRERGHTLDQRGVKAELSELGVHRVGERGGGVFVHHHRT